MRARIAPHARKEREPDEMRVLDMGGKLTEPRRGLKPTCLPRLILMTDAGRLPDPEVAIGKLPRDSAVILRDYDAPDRAARAQVLRASTRRRGLLLLIGADWRLAWRVGADGVHLPEGLVRVTGKIRRARPDWLVTAAAHSRAALRAAEHAGADAALLSPVFPTGSHPGVRALGPVRFAALVREAGLPVYALGGMNKRAMARLRNSGAAGYAGITGLVEAGTG
jgi:thiamine-phosphate pyrophosphorylase